MGLFEGRRRPSKISEMSQSKQHLQLHREALQRRTQQDWANREYVQLMSSSITRIADFLNAFSKSCLGRLSYLDSRLTAIERKVSFLESKVEIVDEQPARQHSSNSKIEEEFQQQQPLPHRTSDESAEEDESLSQARC